MSGDTAAAGDESAGIPGTRELLRTTPVTVWLLVALTAAVGILATVFYPNYRSPDELQHVGLTVAVAERSVDWRPGSQPVQLGVQASPQYAVGRIKSPLYLGKQTMPPRGERRSYQDYGGDQPTTFNNQLVQHPPLYYLITGTVLGLVPHWQTMPFDRVVWLLRLFTVLMLVPVPWLLYAAARTLRGSKGICIAAAATPLLIPQLIHIGASVNNDVLLILLASAATWLATRVLRGDLSRRTALQLGLLSAGVMLTKGFGFVTVGLVVAAFAIGVYRHRQTAGLKRPLRTWGLWFAPPLLVASTWWLGNVVQYHRLIPDGTLRPDQQHANKFPPHTTFADSGSTFVSKWLDDYVQRFWFDDPTAVQHDGNLRLIAIGMTVAALGLAVALVVRPLVDRLFVLAVIGAAAFTTGRLMEIAWPSYRSTKWVGAAQGRYLYALLGGIAIVVAFGLAVLLRGSDRWVARVAVTTALLVNVAASTDTIRMYWVPKPGTANRAWRALQNLFYVSPMPPWALVPVLLAVVGLGLAVLVAVWTPERGARLARRPKAAQAPPKLASDDLDAERALA